MITIRDVAKRANVSPSTVSRVLNDNRAISLSTKEKVLEAVNELGFIPNVLARNFANQSTFTVALVINIENSRAYSNPFFSEVLHGIETLVYSEGYFLIIANERTIAHQQITLDRLVKEKRLDGLILPSAVLKRGLISRLEKEHFPFVVIGEPDLGAERVDFVDINNTLGGEQAVHHLVENGYQKIAYVGGPRVEKFNLKRLKGFIDALRDHGIPPREEMVLEEPDTIMKESGYKLGHRLLSIRNPPDAFVCTDNILAWGVLKAAREKGLEAPRDVGIVSFDSFPLVDFTDPPLSTVDIDVFALGVQAASMLMNRIRMPDLPKQQSLIATRLIARGSSARMEKR